MMIVYRDIINYYEDIFMMKHAGYSISTINKMIPYELELYACLEIERDKKNAVR